ncbi:MAG: hypothetical protein H8E44_33050 [Planctomycetes bacterium]|nr:hypothetical protein [Planctomycetota bacterium]MBL7044450.1 hypothetical protein [Pirellulaceae bacterium]
MYPSLIPHHRLCWQFSAGLLVLATAGLSLASAADDSTNPDSEYWSVRLALNEEHTSRLTGLAAKCKELNMADQAAATSAWLIPRDPRRQYLFLPPESDPAKPPEDAPKIVHQWYAKFSEYRRQQAADLLRLAESELQVDRPTRAFQLVHEVLHEDPDHERAREILGYRKVSGRWRQPAGVIKTRLSRVANPTLGFAASRHWVVESGHFSITTNHSERAGRQLAEQLEELYAVWQQLYFRNWSNRAALERRFEGKSVTSRSIKRHKVVLFRDRQEYLNCLTPIEPLLKMTVGIYLEAKKTAYFYVGEESTAHIWFHEITHQLFSETGRVESGAGLDANFWMVEGVALHMESLQRMSDYYTIGGIDAERLQYARYRALNEGFYVPLDQLAALGRRALQEHENIRRLYSQSAGLASFLMDYRRGLYREAMVDYLIAIYQGRDRAQTLATATGVPLSTLDKQYREFLNVTDDDLAYLASMPSAQSLSLGRTAVTDAGLRHLAGHTRLEWVDVAHTKVGDAGLAHLKSAKGLNHLIAECSQITDAALETIGGFRNLEILDLTGTNITDDGLVHLASLTKLQELWLGGSHVSDAGLVHLQRLKNLETLDVNKTNVTAEGWSRLKKAMPSLNQE